jgi:hypothetical protein
MLVASTCGASVTGIFRCRYSRIGYPFDRETALQECVHLSLRMIRSGVLSLGLFFIVTAFDRAGKAEIANALAVPMRILIVPIYIVWLPLTMAQVAIARRGALPAPIAMIVWVIDMVTGLAPYALADYVLERLRRTRSRK